MGRRAGLAGSVAYSVAFLLLAGSVHAQGWIEPGRPGAFAVSKVRTNVQVTVHERVAEVARAAAPDGAAFLPPPPGRWKNDRCAPPQSRRYATGYKNPRHIRKPPPDGHRHS